MPVPAPKGNKNASPKVGHMVVQAYRELVVFGVITRQQAQAELGVRDGSVRRWFADRPIQYGPPHPVDVLIRQRYVRKQQRKERHERLCAILRAEIARLNQTKLIT